MAHQALTVGETSECNRYRVGLFSVETILLGRSTLGWARPPGASFTRSPNQASVRERRSWSELMKFIHLALLLVTAIGASACATSPFDLFQDARLDDHAQWIKLVHAGMQDTPVSTVILYDGTRPEPVKARGMFVDLVPLTEAQYDAVADYTRATKCAPPPSYPYFGQFTLNRSDGRGRVDDCFMPRAATCDYLTGLLALPGFTATAEVLNPIRDLRATLRCWDFSIYSCTNEGRTEEQGAQTIEACGSDAVEFRDGGVFVGPALTEPRSAPARP